MGQTKRRHFQGPHDKCIVVGPFHVVFGRNLLKHERLVCEALSQVLKAFRRAWLEDVLPAKINLVVKGKGSQLRPMFYGYNFRDGSFIRITPDRLRHPNLHFDIIHEIGHWLHYKKMSSGFRNLRVRKMYLDKMSKYGDAKESHTLLAMGRGVPKAPGDLEDIVRVEGYRNRYEHRYTKALVHPWMPTEYAQVNAQEWFAELLTARLVHPSGYPRAIKTWIRGCFRTS